MRAELASHAKATGWPRGEHFSALASITLVLNEKEGVPPNPLHPGTLRRGRKLP
jgi:hypothetical protein